ncbi:unnamed protein product [Callosobruchus maculatus]|uniref:LRRCT domain-containing protein n=1 Tax=Callosobruchus maculatus TaxID=64391 RepID=A0A653C765_CALMS|nr:unnamed protein product [Callosobruchus maculatus]
MSCPLDMKFTAFLTCAVVYILLFVSCSCDAQPPKCSLKNKSLICSSIDDAFLFEDINELNVTNSYIPSLQPTFFERFPNLNKIVLKNVHLKEIEADTFSKLKALKYLDLGNNNLETFNMSESNRLEYLDLSDNNLQNLSFFDEVNSFNSLKYFDISNNYIKFLPKPLMQKLKTDPSFRLIPDGNPWNCNMSEWSGTLNQELIEWFYNRKPTANCQNGNDRLKLASTLEEETPDEEVTCPTPTCFTQCLFWFFGAIWMGIIIGNVCKIRKLLFSSTRHEDKTTQYGNLIYKQAYALLHSIASCRNDSILFTNR